MAARDSHGPPYLLQEVDVVTGTGSTLEHVDVLIRNGYIQQVSPERLDDAEATSIGARGMTLMPGLIDAHTHLDFLAVRNTPRSWVQTRFVLPRALGELVKHGVTTIRCMADPLKPVRRLRHRARRGRFSSPRIVSAGPALTAPGGHPEATLANDNAWLRKHMTVTLDDADRARATVHKLHTAGVDLIKLVYQGGLYGPERIELQKLTYDVAHAIIDEAHRLGLRVSAHTHYQEDVAALLALGVDSLEHGVLDQELKDPETLLAWAESQTPLVPTLTIAALFSGPDGALYIDTAASNLTTVYQAGVKIVAGTDSMVGAMPANAMHEELQRMVTAGMTPADAIRAATADAAKLLGLTDHGVIEPGRIADLILLNSSPLEQIENVADIDMVFQHGAVVYQAPQPPAPPTLDTYAVAGDRVIEYLDLTKGTVSNEAVVRYDRSRFDSDGIRTLTYLDRNSGEPLRTELVRTDQHLVTAEWECDIPDERTHIHARSNGYRISLTGTLRGNPVRRHYPLRGHTWMQLLQFDAATFVTSSDRQLSVVAIGASGRGALQLTDFEVTKSRQVPGHDDSVEAELVMPRWRRFWAARLHFDAHGGDLVSQHIRGKRHLSLERQSTVRKR